MVNKCRSFTAVHGIIDGVPSLLTPDISVKLFRPLFILSGLLLTSCGVGLCIRADVCADANSLVFALPDKALTLAAVEIDDKEVTVAWTAATGGPGITYSVYYSTTANLDSIEN